MPIKKFIIYMVAIISLCLFVLIFDIGSSPEGLALCIIILALLALRVFCAMVASGMRTISDYVLKRVESGQEIFDNKAYQSYIVTKKGAERIEKIMSSPAPKRPVSASNIISAKDLVEKYKKQPMFPGEKD